MRKMAITLVVILYSFLLGNHARACSCDVPSFESLLRTTNTGITHIFAGRIISVTNATQNSSDRTYLITFAVIKNWGRAKDSIVTVYQGTTSCDRFIPLGINPSRIILFTGFYGGSPNSPRNFVSTNSCLPIGSVSDVDFPAISRQFDSLAALPKLIGSGVEQISSPEFIIFPNPSVNQATIEYSISKSSAVKIELLNSLGQVQLNIATHSLKSVGFHEEPIALEGLVQGIYFCRISTSEGVTIRKLVVNR